MKKATIFSAFFLALTLILSGCAKSSQAPGQAVSDNKTGRTRMPDFGQPDRAPDVRGIVKSIVGNEITVLKIDMPAGGRNASSTPQGKDSENNGLDSRAAVSLTGATGARTGGRMMAGGPGGGPGGPGEQTEESRAQMLAKLKELSTGEDKIIIPVGIKMLKMDTSNNKRQMVEATLADITADKNITVWLSSGAVSSSDGVASTTASTTATANIKKIAEFVLIN